MAVVCPKTGRGQYELTYEVLAEAPKGMTAREIAEYMGRSYLCTLDSIRRLRRSDPPRIHIARYEQQVGQGGRATPVYAIGDFEDAQEKRLSSKARNKRYRERNKAVITARNRVRNNSNFNFWGGLIK